MTPPPSLATLVDTFDWSTTPLGPRDQWPPSLRATVHLVLSSPFPMVVLWGERLVQVYNDGYAVILGPRHPRALGQPTRETWPEVWHINEPLYQRVWCGETHYFENQRYPITRHGVEEEAYFTLSYSPLHDDHDSIGGVLVTVTETTPQVLLARRQHAAQRLAVRLAEATTLDDVRRLFTAPDPLPDLPFAELHLPTDGAIPAPLREVLASGEPGLLDWPRGGAPQPALAVPVRSRQPDCGAGVLVLGLHPPAPPSEPYRLFLTQYAGQVEATLMRVCAEQARQLSDVRFRLFVTATSDTIYRMSADWREMYALDGKNVLEDTTDPTAYWLDAYIPDAEKADVQAAIDEAVRTKTPFELEHRVRLADGGVGWTLSRAVPFLDERGEIVEWFGAASHITGRKRAEALVQELRLALEQQYARRERELARQSAELEQSNSALQATNEELEAFNYSVSHDLMTPVRHVAGFSNMAARHLHDPDKARRYLEIVKQAAERMETLIQAMLTLSRTGLQDVSSHPVDLNVLAAQARLDVLQELGERAVEWRLGELPTVQGDHVTLQQVLTNLLGNAVKYTRERNPAVIEVWAEDGERQWCVFVRDNGAGFDPRYAGKLFGIFQRLHRQDEFEGTGVGLSLVRRIVTRHGGRVWAEGRPGEGATFAFSLPKEPAGASAGDRGPGGRR